MDNTTSQTISALEEVLIRQVKSSGVAIPDSILRGVVNKVVTDYSPAATKQVTSLSKQTVNDVPNQIIGPVNPLNLVTENRNAANVTSTIGFGVQDQLSGVLTNALLSSFTKELRLALPSSTSSKIDFNALTNVLTAAVTPAVNSTINNVVDNFASSIFSTNKTVPRLSFNPDRLYGTLGSEAAQTEITRAFSLGAADRFVQSASKFNVNNNDNQEKLKVLSTGFTDTTAKYPSKEYSGKSEINKLSRGEVNGTIVQSKNNERMIGAKLPNGTSWEQPQSPYRGSYPYNKVTQTESGHIIEIDDTPGAERLHIYHKSGTFMEIDPNGSIIKRTKGSSYEIIDRNGKIAISGQADISVNGPCNIFVGQDASIEVTGNTILNCFNDITAQAGGKFFLSAVEEFNISSANVNIEAYREMNMRANTLMNLAVEKEMNMRANTNMYVQTIGQHHSKHGSMFVQTDGQFHSKNGGTFNVDASEVYLNSQTASTASGSKMAGFSKAGIIEGRKDFIPIDTPDPNFISLADEYALELEEERENETTYKKHRDKIIKAGFSTPEQFDTRPIVQQSEFISSGRSYRVNPSDSLLDVTNLPDNYNLSPNFTIGSVSSECSITKDKITENTNINTTFGRIAYNLQFLCLNVLEPAVNLYPNLVVASGFRALENSSPNSLHPHGKAVDLTFKGSTPEEVYDIAKILAEVLIYDTLILEFTNYGQAPWIHISLSPDSTNRKLLRTFWNNRKFSDNLSMLV